jgi:NAD+ diphosphatase
MTGLPDSYASPRHLPFNSTCLDDQFLFESADRDPGGIGCWLLLRGTELLLPETGGALTLPVGASPALPGLSAPLYFGRWQQMSCRTASLAKDAPLPIGWVAHNLMAPDPLLPIDLLSLGALARQLLQWQENSCHCSRCGSEQQTMPGEWGRRCNGCGALHFPHIHPCVIVIVRRPGELLLTRKAEWPPGRYSLVAGFLDLGECLEEAVEREVREETGVEITNIRYVGSQSWPFPSQLMAGFVADYVSGEVCVEEKELEDARWFSIDALPQLPPKRSIARYLIDHHALADLS